MNSGIPLPLFAATHEQAQGWPKQAPHRVVDSLPVSVDPRYLRSLGELNLRITEANRTMRR